MEQHYAISASRAGHVRAGRAWTLEPTIVAASDLTLTQLEMLRADPGITVVPCAPPAAVSTDELLAAMPLDELRARLIRRACRELDPAEDLTSGGAPEVSALKRLTGLASISAAERDQAWADHEKAEAAG